MAVVPDEPAEVVSRSSMSVARWTLVSRLTGFARTVVIAAILGPTYFGNTFQATNFLPNLVFELIAGSLLVSLLVPALVRHVDARDRAATERVAGSFLGLTMTAFTAVAVVAVLAAPLILAALSATVSDAQTAADQRRVGFVLLVLLMPQVVLYGIAGVGAAVQNAHGRFGLAAAASTFENLGVIATMAVFGIAYGSGVSIGDVGTGPLVLLGLGSTLAVGLHAGAQWWGAYRVGVRLVPRRGWREPEVRDLVSKALPSVGYSALNALRTFVPTVVANSVPGGVVAFYLAQNFFYLPIAIGARPIATAVLPRLSRLAQAARLAELRVELVSAAGVVAFLVVPAVAIYLALSVPLARAAAFGQIATSHGVELVAASVASLACGVIGEAAFVLATSASYALGDARLPLRAMVLRTAVALGGMSVALAVRGDVETLVALGLAITTADLVGASALTRWVSAKLPRDGRRMLPAVGRAVAASALMLVPAGGLALLLSTADRRGSFAAVATMVAIGVAGLATYLAVQRRWRSPELVFVLTGFGSAGDR